MKQIGAVWLVFVLSAGPVSAPVNVGPKLPKPKKQSALCAAFDPWSAPWVLFGCMFEPNEKDPRVG